MPKRFGEEVEKRKVPTVAPDTLRRVRSGACVPQQQCYRNPISESAGVAMSRGREGTISWRSTDPYPRDVGTRWRMRRIWRCTKSMGQNRFWESRTHPTGIDKRTLSFGGGKKTPVRAPLVDFAVGVGRSPATGWGGGGSYIFFIFLRSPETAKTSPPKIVRKKNKKSAGRRPGGGGTTRG